MIKTGAVTVTATQRLGIFVLFALLFSSTTQAGVSWQTSSNISSDTGNTYSVAVGDVDGDGSLDIVAGNNLVNRLYRAQGDSNIGTDEYSTRSVVLADVDGDGDLDLITGNAAAFSGQVNRLYLNDGLGNFGNGTDITADANRTISIALGDVDNDGDLDLVAGNDGTANRLYLNDLNNGGSGSFGAGSNITNDAHGTQSVALADVDGDGYLDLVVGNYNQTNRLYLNDGNGNFPAGSDITGDTNATYSVALGDMDGDGDLDLVTGNYNNETNRLYLNTGVVFGAGSDISADVHDTFSIALVDVDNDGDLDVVAGNDGQTNRLTLNNGAANFDAGSDIGTDTHNTYSVALGDFDGNGYLDLVSGNFTQVNRGTLNRGSGNFDTGADSSIDASNTYPVVLGDVNGDGFLDLVAGNYGSGSGEINRLYLGNGAGYFVPGTDISTDAHKTTSAALGDVDGDGDLDLVVGNEGEANRLYLNDLNNGGSGVFDAGTNISDDAHTTNSVVLVDVEGDGDLDLIVGNYSGQANRLYLNGGSGNFGAGTNITDDAHSTASVAVGDVNGDGFPDMVAGNSGVNRLYLSLGNGTFGAGTDIGSDAHNTQSVALADVDGDGDLDLVVGNYDQTNRLYLNDGSGTFDAGTDIGSDTDSTTSITLGDVDGDGDLDVVAGNAGVNSLYLNNGGGSYDTGSDITDITGGLDVTYFTHSVALADIDDDGDLDLVTGNTSVIREYRNIRARRILTNLSIPSSLNEVAGTVSIPVPCMGSTATAGSVEYAFSSGSATAGSDFTGSNGALAWSAGNCAAHTITLTIIDDDLAEADETLILTFSNPQGIYLNDPLSQTLSYSFVIKANDTSTGGGSSGGGGGGGGSSDALWLLALAFGLRARLRGKAIFRKRDNQQV